MDPECLKVIKLSQEAFSNVIFFVMDSQNPDPMTAKGPVDSRRQNLFRECKSFELLIEFLQIPFKEFTENGWIPLEDVRLSEHLQIQKYCQYCFRVSLSLQTLFISKASVDKQTNKYQYTAD